MLHGRLIAGLAARAVERDHVDASFGVARLTVDLFRSPPMDILEVTSQVVRAGRRVKVVDVTVSGRDGALARVTALILAEGEQPSGRIWSPPAWSAPDPESLPPPGPAQRGRIPTDMRTISMGGEGEPPVQRRAWIRDSHVLVAAEPLTPLVRAAIAADFASPFALSGEEGLSFINADYTLYLGRLPQSEWIGLESGGQVSATGIGVGQCTMHDLRGAVGYVTVGAVANRRLG